MRGRARVSGRTRAYPQGYESAAQMAGPTRSGLSWFPTASIWSAILAAQAAGIETSAEWIRMERVIERGSNGGRVRRVVRALPRSLSADRGRYARPRPARGLRAGGASVV